MPKIKNRLLEYLEINNITKKKFSEITNISYANIVGNSLNSELGGEQISEIVMKFPTLNPDWFLTGKGDMLRKNEGKNNQIDLLDMVSLEKYEKKVEECALLRAQIKVLKSRAPYDFVCENTGTDVLNI